MPYNFSIEYAGMTRIMTACDISNFSDKLVEDLSIDIDIVMKSSKLMAFKNSENFLNDEYLKNHSNKDFITNITRVYEYSISRSIDVFNTSKKIPRKLSTYAFLENIFFLDLCSIIKDYNNNNFDFDYEDYGGGYTNEDDYKAGALFGATDYLESTHPGRYEDDGQFDSQFFGLYEDEIDTDYDEGEETEDYDMDALKPTDEDYDKLTKYTIDIAKKATESEIKIISDAIDKVIIPTYKGLMRNIDNSILVMPIIAFTVKKAPAAVIKKLKSGDIHFIIKNEYGEIEEY